jgi:hypothetical protein
MVMARPEVTDINLFFMNAKSSPELTLELTSFFTEVFGAEVVQKNKRYEHLFYKMLINHIYTRKIIDFIQEFNISPKATYHQNPLIFIALGITRGQQTFTFNPELADYLLNRGIELNKLEYTEYIEEDSSNINLLMAAILARNIDAVIYLLEKGASKNSKAQNGIYNNFTLVDILDYHINLSNTRLENVNQTLQRLKNLNISTLTPNQKRNLLRNTYHNINDDEVYPNNDLTSLVEEEEDIILSQISSLENILNEYKTIKNLIKAPYTNNNIKTAKNRLKPNMRTITGALGYRGVKGKTLPQNVIQTLSSYMTTAYNTKKTRKARRSRKSRR